jgi:hypothetical protein
VFAYSNRHEDQRGLVIYHNKFRDTRGWIKTSAAFMDKHLHKRVHRSLGEGLGLSRNGFVIFKDYVTGLEYIRPCRELWEKGLYVELNAYQCHVFMDWRFVGDKEWKTICDALNGAGVESMDAKWKEMFAAKEQVKNEQKEPREKQVRAKKIKIISKETVNAEKEKSVVKKKAATKKQVIAHGILNRTRKTSKPATPKAVAQKHGEKQVEIKIESPVAKRKAAKPVKKKTSRSKK